jgi:hypothetical protein
MNLTNQLFIRGSTSNSQPAEILIQQRFGQRILVIEEEGFFQAKSTNHYDLIGIEAAKTVQNLMGTKNI